MIPAHWARPGSAVKYTWFAENLCIFFLTGGDKIYARWDEKSTLQPVIIDSFSDDLIHLGGTRWLNRRIGSGSVQQPDVD